MKKIRQSVFETNSSSTHSLIFCSKEEYNLLEKDQLYITYDKKFITKDEYKKYIIDTFIENKYFDTYFDSKSYFTFYKEFLHKDFFTKLQQVGLVELIEIKDDTIKSEDPITFIIDNYLKEIDKDFKFYNKFYDTFFEELESFENDNKYDYDLPMLIDDWVGDLGSDTYEYISKSGDNIVAIVKYGYV